MTLMNSDLMDDFSHEQQAQDIQAERSVLGAVLIDSSALDEIRPMLEVRDFSQSTHQLIYKVMLYLDDRDIPIDLVTVTEHFQKHDRLQDMGGVSYITQLANSCPTASNVKYYAQIVRSKAHRRRGMELGRKIIELSMADGETYETDEDFFAAVEDKVTDLRPQDTGRMVSFSETKVEYFDHLESSPEKLKTGWFPSFDDWAQLWRGWLYIVAGRPSVGKTAKALQLAHGIARHNPNSGVVLIFSQEMGINEVKDRLVSMVAEINYPKLINKGGQEGFTKEEWGRIGEAYALIERLPIFVQDSAGVTIDEIRATAKQFKKRYGKIAAIIVDYLQIMEIPQRKSETRAQAIGRVTRAAKQLARSMNFVFIMLSQLDRSVDDEEPKLKHLKESGSIEQDADVVEFLWYNAKDQPENNKKIIDSIFAKGRNVGVNRFKLEFRWWYQKYVEYISPKKGWSSGERKTNRK